MKLLINHSKRNTKTNSTIIYGDNRNILVLTIEDILSEKSKTDFRGFEFSIVLVPKELQERKGFSACKKILNHSVIWKKIVHCFAKNGKIIYY